MSTVSILSAAFMLLITAGPAPTPRGQDAQGSPAPDVIESGADTYAFHCAACHGTAGRGDGPVAASLRHRPSNLTTIARRRGGRFPRQEMMDFVIGRGRQVAAHGTHDMPVWGPLFRQLNPFDSRVDVRLARLINHLESIQIK